MFFIGVISSKRKFDTISDLLKEKINKNEATLIRINMKSIKNLKSVRFDILVIDSLEKMEERIISINSICKNLKYLIINSDIELRNKLILNVETNIVTCGLNHKASITFSSVTDEKLLISVQRSFCGINNKLIDVGEYIEKISIEQRTCLNEILLVFAIAKLIE